MHRPDPLTGLRKPTDDRFREVLYNTLLAEELGFDGFGVGERHERRCRRTSGARSSRTRYGGRRTR
ncbi:hypothetical protein GCM10010365_20150 [Streptomyces poonensis]|uniref:Uncharacterized protein n=1 Tax=Streptomyces poonensis TaxID=68255 RepID=A0A918PD59_9ACTN|nr:hypothetical protein GCM10010365_20150 [Streptomyces poonensis]GLJ90371.1 hypothetical protein GCM10017589_29740 [Streptomyces poonensis]